MELRIETIIFLAVLFVIGSKLFQKGMLENFDAKLGQCDEFGYIQQPQHRMFINPEYKGSSCLYAKVPQPQSDTIYVSEIEWDYIKNKHSKGTNLNTCQLGFGPTYCGRV